jgi:hypothetical protein
MHIGESDGDVAPTACHSWRSCSLFCPAEAKTPLQLRRMSTSTAQTKNLHLELRTSYYNRCAPRLVSDSCLGHDARCSISYDKGRYRQHRAQSFVQPVDCALPRAGRLQYSPTFSSREGLVSFCSETQKAASNQVIF